MILCKACDDPSSKDIERQIWLGEMTVTNAARAVGMSYDDYWDHLQNHKPKKSPTQKEPDQVLDNLIIKLDGRATKLLSQPMNLTYEKVIVSELRLLKDLAMDIAKLQHKIQETPQIQIQNFIMHQQKLTTFLLDNLCPVCKEQVVKFLELKPNA